MARCSENGNTCRRRSGLAAFAAPRNGGAGFHCPKCWRLATFTAPATCAKLRCSCWGCSTMMRGFMPALRVLGTKFVLPFLLAVLCVMVSLPASAQDKVLRVGTLKLIHGISVYFYEK